MGTGLAPHRLRPTAKRGGPSTDEDLAVLRVPAAQAGSAVGSADVAHELPDGRPGVRLTVTDDGTGDDGTHGTMSTQCSPR
ncbi:hypothetical protein [Streptomyces lavendofoliae]|uniref:hypothetical protein n=1 Tax=Streptomyces lavendofoliae TaxID=67314 RepID=UPI003D8BBA02